MHSLLSAKPSLAALALASGLLVCSPLQAHSISGAIYTSTGDHSEVNANQYDSKDAVYLNGGPSNAQCNGGALSNGDYYFQVTNPSGSQLLSTDHISQRRFTVSGGVISSYTGSHGVGGTSACGSVAIQLVPFDDSPNSGGVYKVWITHASDFIAACGAGVDCGLAGFKAGHTKSDNFKVKETNPEEPLLDGVLNAYKFYDANANGAWDGGELPLAGWPMTINPVDGAPESQTQLTNVDGLVAWTQLSPGDYSVEEGTPTQTNWFQSAPVDEFDNPVNPVTGLAVVASETTIVEFGNYCLVGSGGKTLGFWSNKNGQASFNTGGDGLAMLVALNLRNANGTHFDPANYTGFRAWLLGGTATNMAYMLSVQMAAMSLNIKSGFVDGDAFYVPYGGTINALVAEANTLLAGAADLVTTAGHPLRADQERLKNYLDELNNGALVIPVTPCARTFP